MYEKQVWIDGVSVGTAERFNHMESGISANSENISKTQSNAYFIGRYTSDLETKQSQSTILSPDKLIMNNMTFEDGILTVGEDGLYYINVYIHLNHGVKRSFVDVGIEDGGILAPTVIRSQDTQNMLYDEETPNAGDPAYELNRPIFLKKGSKLKFSFWAVKDVNISGNEEFNTESSNIAVVKVGNYPEAV